LEPVEDPKEEPSDTTEPAETPDDSKTSDDNTDASLEAQSLDINTGTLNFSDVEENYTQANETLSVTVTNTGDSAVTLRIPQSEYFNVLNEDGSEAASGTQLAKGESIMFMVQPKTGLTKGDYSDTLVFGSNEESEVTAQVTAEISVKEAQQQITEIQADPASVNYDDLKEGYDTPDSTTVTLTNTGNTTVSLVQPVGEYFNIGELSASELNPGDSAEFTVTPVTGLTAGDYMDSIQIMQTNADGQEEVLTTVNASITVSEVEKIYKLSVDPTELDFGNTKAGYGEAPEAQKVTVTNEGNTNVTLNTPSAKNFKIGKFSATELAPGESATFKIRPKEGLKAGSYTEAIAVNTDQNVSAKVNVKFTVKTVRKAKIADPADNKITGISFEGYTTQSKITFTAVGAGMDNESPGKGDVRYVPYNWKVINTNSWSSAPYTAAFGITKAGTYTLTVVFDRQMYNGKEWENTGEQDTKQVNFNITQAQTVTPTPQPNGATAKSAVKTGDTTNIAPFVIILVIAAGCIAGVVVYKKKKK
jgi:LPXTG-motif cell wall-anchored protein